MFKIIEIGSLQRNSDKINLPSNIIFYEKWVFRDKFLTNSYDPSTFGK